MAPEQRGLRLLLALQAPHLARQPARPALGREALLQQAAQHHVDAARRRPARPRLSAAPAHRESARQRHRLVQQPLAARAVQQVPRRRGDRGRRPPARRLPGGAARLSHRRPPVARARDARQAARQLPQLVGPQRPEPRGAAKRAQGLGEAAGAGQRVPQPQAQAAVWPRQAGQRGAEELGRRLVLARAEGLVALLHPLGERLPAVAAATGGRRRDRLGAHHRGAAATRAGGKNGEGRMLAARARRLQRGNHLRREPRASVGERCAAGCATTAGGGRRVGPRLPRGVGCRGRGGHGGRGRAPARGERPPRSPGLGSRAAGGKAATPPRSASPQTLSLLAPGGPARASACALVSTRPRPARSLPAPRSSSAVRCRPRAWSRCLRPAVPPCPRTECQPGSKAWPSPPAVVVKKRTDK